MRQFSQSKNETLAAIKLPNSLPERSHQLSSSFIARVKAEMDKPRVAAKPSFNTRTFDALNKITTEDWKRQMEEERKRGELSLLHETSNNVNL